jgi:gas vesicle protein
MTNGTKIVLALLGGVVLGATTALLFAPKTGKDLRSEIAQIAREKYNQLSNGEISRIVDRVMRRIRNGVCQCDSREDIAQAVDEVANEK